jgi:hypothetical protein
MAFFVPHLIAQQAPGLQTKTGTESRAGESTARLLRVRLGPHGLIGSGVRHAHSGPIYHDHPSSVQSLAGSSGLQPGRGVVQNGFKTGESQLFPRLAVGRRGRRGQDGGLQGGKRLELADDFLAPTVSSQHLREKGPKGVFFTEYSPATQGA